jgi:4-amino-4-deoxy-L-arabinose transferase-like glycosyltransferase
MLSLVRRILAGWAPLRSCLAERRYALGVTLVLALAAWNCFYGLGSSRLDDMDEARYGVSAYEMTQDHSLVVTTYGHEREYWNLKPPLGYWLIAGSFTLLGPSFFALRLPSALCGLGVVALTLLIGRRWFNARVSLLAGLFVATAYGFFSHHGARSGDLDAALTLLLLAALLQIERLGESPWRIVGLSLCLALGFLLKSFAVLPILLVAALYFVWSGAWRRQRALLVLLAVLVFALPVAGWAAARWHADASPYFLERMVREDLCDRSLRVIDQVTYSPWSYVGALHDRLAPWPAMVWVGAILGARRRRWRLGALYERLAEGRLPLLLLWAFVPFVLFSLARTQHHWYLDPVYPAWALLGAVALTGLLGRSAPGRWRAGLLALVVLLTLGCELRVLDRVLIRDRLPESQRFLLSLAARRAALGPALRSGRLRHSERFILEAMDGFQVEEPGRHRFGRGPRQLAAVGGLGAASRPPLASPEPQPAPGAVLLVESPDYAVYAAPPGRRAPGLAPPTVLSRKPGWFDRHPHRQKGGPGGCCGKRRRVPAPLRVSGLVPQGVPEVAAACFPTVSG